MEANTVLYVLAVLVIMFLSMLGTFHHAYDDTLLQRVGMGVSWLGSLGVLSQTDPTSPSNSNLLMLMGIATYAIGTAIKQHKKARHRHGLR